MRYGGLFAAGLVALTGGCVPVQAQQAAQAASAQTAAPGALNAAEQAQFDEAGKDFAAAKYDQALPIFRALAGAHPENARVLKFAAESAIDTGDLQYARNTLEQLAAQNPDDWQATGLLARVYAESGEKVKRDEEMARMADLHQRGLVPANLQQYLLERVQQDGKVVWIWHSLTPWGRYRVYDYARVFDAQGNLLLRITLESADSDQPLFAKDHPAEAAAGKRLFSLDGYRDLGATPEGGRREEHMTFGFRVGEPSYDEVREDFVKIATGKWNPASQTTLTGK